MYLTPNHVFILDAGLSGYHHERPTRLLFSEDGGQCITSDELLWYIARDPDGAGGFLAKNKELEVSLNKIVLTLLKLESRHFDAAGRLQVDFGNRPYGYNITDFDQTIPGKLVRQVKQSLLESFGNQSL